MMLSFKSYLAEESTKNTHMTHLEDSVLIGGVNGARESINYLRNLRDMLAGKSKGKVNVTVKWDGAPAVFAGTDPSDGKFFVAKKGIFNKNAKVYKSNADIDADIASGDLNDKMKLALSELSKLDIKGVIQGDFLYSRNDIKTVDIDGEPHITFHPNTIVYAVPKNSKLAQQILGSKIGVVWHTTYRGNDFESMSASFGKEIASGLKNTKEVWSVDAMYRDVAGTATFTEAETKKVTDVLSSAGKVFNTIKRDTFQGISDNEALLMTTMTYINTYVRAGQGIKNTSSFVDGLKEYINAKYQKDEDKLKTEKGKEGVRAKKQATMQYFSDTPKAQIVALFNLYNLIAQAKLMIVRKLDKAKTIGTFLKTVDGYKVTEQEGFVAIDHMGKNAVKLVDRLQFSNANFSADIIKGWQK